MLDVRYWMLDEQSGDILVGSNRNLNQLLSAVRGVDFLGQKSGVLSRGEVRGRWNSCGFHWVWWTKRAGYCPSRSPFLEYRGQKLVGFWGRRINHGGTEGTEVVEFARRAQVGMPPKS